MTEVPIAGLLGFNKYSQFRRAGSESDVVAVFFNSSLPSEREVTEITRLMASGHHLDCSPSCATEAGEHEIRDRCTKA